MEIVHSHPYVKVNREIVNNYQNFVETVHYINLYTDKIIIPTHEFNLFEVLDISYKPLAQNYLLYLHTNQGVFTFNTATAPDILITEFKRQKNN
ncbi:hypothetical protein [Aquibacillus rhizosphaerae]|uniref:Uncharacterized protein n=1 Tax=Aquibacillus rhizosphaerae TaxID=3051431 RepID=A0ABT7L8I9_9BACI|nr:hypothetical protein [Aquibacillus sp. LR5S19]MDL4842188.1 hypothetical protein [Aquibacillus sp. LR5S19]